ncbi:hypothetical protein D5018_07945 [Parashewanella curva]|uniref:Uncharacterized protein n=1 Tax=Parashewanella curva TaxID=2338552 RepID=A0A3L8PZI4_9GAMM|nr:hypothetical protein [Parashewanella curva]RLV60189.1 hypothetical protein D5018_07945 [Parashewanella curva]
MAFIPAQAGAFSTSLEMCSPPVFYPAHAPAHFNYGHLYYNVCLQSTANDTRVAANQQARQVLYFNNVQPPNVYPQNYFTYSFSPPYPYHERHQALTSVHLLTASIYQGEVVNERTERRLSGLVNQCETLAQLKEIIIAVKNIGQAPGWNVLLIEKMLKKCIKLGKNDKEINRTEIQVVINLIMSLPSQFITEKGDRLRYSPKTITLFLKACALTQDLERAKQILIDRNGEESLLTSWGISVNIKHINTFILVCVATKEWRFVWEAITNNSLMITLGNHTPNTETCLNLLRLCAKTKHFSEAKWLLFGDKEHESFVSEHNITPKYKVVREFVITCFAAQRALASIDELIDAINQWKIPMKPLIRAYTATLEPDKFDKAISTGLAENVFLPNLGLNDNCLEFNFQTIFANSSKDDIDSLGIPFEFAKLLFEYHVMTRGHNVLQFIADPNWGSHLRLKLAKFSMEKFNKTFVNTLTSPNRFRYLPEDTSSSLNSSNSKNTSS